MRRCLISGCIIVVVVFWFSACQKEEQEALHSEVQEAVVPSYGDIFIDGSIGDASTLIPMLASDSVSHSIASLLYNGLVKYDKNLKLVGDLAHSWDVTNNGLTITFHLKKGVKWHDGVECTAKDVLFGYQTITDPRTPTAYSGDFVEVKEARVIDPYTFQVDYKRPFAPGLASWGSLVVLPKHLLVGKDIAQSPLSHHPIGTGPYRFSEWKTGEKIVITSNHEYFTGRPYIDGYIMRIIPDQATMFLELKSGGIDSMSLTPIQYMRQTDTTLFQENFKKYKYLAFAYVYLGYNLKNPLFADTKVRQALTFAIDKEEIIKGVLLGLGEVATGPYKPGTWYYKQNVKRYPHNPSRTRKLLRKAGWVHDEKDNLMKKDGIPFHFTILTNQGNDQRLKTAVIIQRRLKMAGILVKIRTVEWATFINEFIDKKNFDAVILGWSTGQDPDIYDIWHSSKTKPKELNFMSYANARVDELLEKGRYTFDREVRKQCYAKIQEILAEEQPYTFLYVPYALPIIHKRFRGIRPAPAGIFYNFHEWYVPKPEHTHTMLP